MKLILALALVVSFVAMVPQPIRAGSQAAISASDGIYTEEQSARGRKSYVQHCSACHGHDLRGGSSGGDVAPPLTGQEFVAGWDGQTVGDLFERIRISMPQDSPGSLSGQENADILAFVLASNKLPAGRTELATEATTLKTIKLALDKSTS